MDEPTPAATVPKLILLGEKGRAQNQLETNGTTINLTIQEPKPNRFASGSAQSPDSSSPNPSPSPPTTPGGISRVDTVRKYAPSPMLAQKSSSFDLQAMLQALRTGVEQDPAPIVLNSHVAPDLNAPPKHKVEDLPLPAPASAVDFNQPLEADLKLLSYTLMNIVKHEVSNAQGPEKSEELVAMLEAFLIAGRIYHQDPTDENFEKLIQLAHQVESDNGFLDIARASSEFLGLSELAERGHRVRRWRAYRRGESNLFFKHTMADAFGKLLSSGISKEDIRQAIMKQKVDLTLTAHPTQATRKTLLGKYHRIADLLAYKDQQIMTPDEAQALEEDVTREIFAIWSSNSVRRNRPSPSDEARNGLAVVEDVLFQAVPNFMRVLDDSLDAIGADPLPPDSVPIQFGSWIGGDRDGNPFVTHETTLSVISFAKWRASELYYQEIDKLLFELSMNRCTTEFRDWLEAEIKPHLQKSQGTQGSGLGGQLRSWDFTSGPKVPEDEPYRIALAHLRERMQATTRYLSQLAVNPTVEIPEPASMIKNVEELMEPLKKIYESLRATNAEIIASGRLTDLIRRLSVFGLSLVKLDIRQESDQHTETLDYITKYLGLGSYRDDWDEDKRQSWLLQELKSKRPLVPPEWPQNDDTVPPIVKEVIATFRLLPRVKDAIATYIISMARTPSDVLAVCLMQQKFGMPHPLIKVSPLFETKSDLENGPNTIRKLLSLDWYREAINGKQEIMLGYSDSAKDASRCASVWSLFVAQEALVKTCDYWGVELSMMHGRGGPSSRGGGPQHLAILSQPGSTMRVGNLLRTTIQGEIIDTHFGSLKVAEQTLERYTNATLLATLLPQPDPKPEWRKVMGEMSEASCAYYRKLVFETPDFVEYLRTATPNLELGILNIGSRPSKRRAGGIETLRAIPWIFSWNQTRLNVPAWLGLGHALRQQFDQGKLPLLKQMYKEWPFFQSTLDLVQMVMAKADTRVAAFYDQLLVPDNLKDLGHTLREEFRSTRQAILDVSEQEFLLEKDPVVRRAVETRMPWTTQLNLLQAQILKKMRAMDEDQVPGKLKDAFIVSVQGISKGVGNTG